MPMCFSLYESWLDDEGNQIPARHGRHIAEERAYHRRCSVPAAPTTTKVQIVMSPESKPPATEVCYVPRYVPAAPLLPAPEPTFTIEATAAEIASRIVSENATRNEVEALQNKLEEEQKLRLKAECERDREEVRRLKQEISSDCYSRDLCRMEDDARRRIAEEYRLHSGFLESSHSYASSEESLWSTTPRASTSHDGRLLVHDHRHTHHRSHPDFRHHRCSCCGHSGHRSRECPERTVYKAPTNRVRHIQYSS